jgi:hypothetical protein
MFSPPNRFRFRRSSRPQKVQPAKPVLDYEVPPQEADDDVDPPRWKEWLDAFITYGIAEPILTLAIVIFLLWLIFG